MKTQHYLLVIAFVILNSVSAKATEKDYKNKMEKELRGLDEIKGKEEWIKKANAFGQITEVHPDEWLPLYYQSYSYLQAGMVEQDLKKADLQYDLALSYIEKAETIEKSNSEINTLKSWILSMKIPVDPMTRGYEFGMLSNQLLSAAMMQDATNPRPYLLKGITAFYTPEEFGGSKKVAKEVLNESLKKFAVFKPSSPIMPVWGLKDVKEMLIELENE